MGPEVCRSAASRAAAAAVWMLVVPPWRPAPLAHHSQTMFEAGQLTVSGTVDKVRYASPHISVFIDLDVDGKTRSFRLEGGSPATLREHGWTAKTLSAGDRVTVTFSKSKDGSNLGLLRSLTRADGTVLHGGAGEQR